MSDVKILHPDVQYAVRKAEKTSFFSLLKGNGQTNRLPVAETPSSHTFVSLPEEVDILKGKILGQNGGFLVKMGIFPK